MKKILLLVAAAAFAGVTVNAEKRTKSQILSAAAEVLQTKALKTTAAGQKLELQILDNSFAQLSIVGYPTGSYVVVANDDAMPAVIGYSDSKFDTENMAPAFKWYLELANKNIEECLANGTSLPKTKINPEYKEEVPMLCQTLWGQADPFFRKTPVNEEDGQNYVTGCVATAMAQAMKYYNYPDTGRGKISFTYTPPKGEGSSGKVRLRFDEEMFDWNNMLNEYVQHRFTNDEADAVAYLMKCTGASVKMQYASSGSGAYTHDVPTAFYTYFKYDRSMDCYNAGYYTTDEWYDIAYRSLDKGYPLIFGAASSIGGQDAGHSFVVDGYNKEGLVHVNFGWNGDADGYYSLLNMHGYDHDFEMVPLYKPLENSKITSKWGMWGNVLSYNHGDIKAQIINTSSRDFTGKVAVILKSLADGSEHMLDYMSYKDEGYIKDGRYLNIIDYTASAEIPADLPDGEYRLFLASKGAWMLKDDPTDRNGEEYLVEEDAWQPVRCSDGRSNSLLVTITGGKSEVKPDNDPTWVLAIDNVITTNHTSDIVRVYDLQGRMVYTSKAADFRIADVPAEGMLIIKEGTEVRKVMK